MKIGILGGGQLGRMLALAGHPLGLEFCIYEPLADTSAKQVTEGVTAEYSDLDALEAFASDVDVVTYEFENVPIESLNFLKSKKNIYPSIDALFASQDRLNEKQLFQKLEIPAAKFAIASDSKQLTQAVNEVGIPCVVKTRRLGYDGKGQKVLHTAPQSFDQIWKELGGANLIVEELIPFDREVSQICAFDLKQNSATYPLTENVHRNGILRQSIAPASNSDSALSKQAHEYVQRIAKHFGYVGVLTVEFFVVGDKLIANEMAPRVHNSGHWTMDANIASQFENHVRAIAGLPLGATEIDGFFGMVNLIGEIPPVDKFAIPNVTLHAYGKDPRPGRKVGHVNVCSQTREGLDSLIKQIS